MGKKGCRKKKFQPLQQWLALHPSDPPKEWIDLPADLTENILQRLSPVEILATAQNVCATWRTVCRDPVMWRFIDMRYDHRRLRRSLSCCQLRLNGFLRSTCRRAVDYSKGELIDINIECFGDDDLLLYISDRSSHLRYLRIEDCNSITDKGLTTAVTKLPELEELHMSFFYFSAKDIQTIGNFCPMLKSFTNNVGAKNHRRVDNRCALEIARNMPNLRHLGLYGNPLSERGVKSILDGCPRLESIDLRDCFNVGLDKRLCFESIHDLRRLFDRSIDQWDEEGCGYYSDTSSIVDSFCCCRSCDPFNNSCCRACGGSDDDKDHIHEEDGHEDDDDLYSRFSMVLKDVVIAKLGGRPRPGGSN